MEAGCVSKESGVALPNGRVSDGALRHQAEPRPSGSDVGLAGERHGIIRYMKFSLCAAFAATALSAQTFSGAAALDLTINQAIEQGRMPGAVLIVGHDGKVVYRKAYGKRALVPEPEAMTLDTVFDCASLTKVVATTASLMKLFEEGKFRLNDKVTDYIREFQGGNSNITLRNLFTHF